MQFHFMIFTLFSIIVQANGMSLGKSEIVAQFNQIIRVRNVDTEQFSRTKFVSLGSQKFPVRNYVDDVFSWLTSVEKVNSAEKRGSFEQFLKFGFK